MMILVVLSMVLLLADIVVSSTRNKGLPTCVSECYYCVGWWHYLLLMGASVLMLPAMLMATPDDYQALAFLCCASLCFVGNAPDYKDKALEQSVHEWSAIMAAVASVAWCAVCCPVALVMLTVALMGVVDRTRWLLYAELGCFASVYVGMMVG